MSETEPSPGPATPGREETEAGTRIPPESGAAGALDIQDVMTLIPHRYPLLLVDRILERVPGKRAVGIKAVSANEPFFQGHFPEYPLMPGVLLVEALAQTAAVFVAAEADTDKSESMVYFMGIDEARFRKPVRPGDTLRLEVDLARRRGRVFKFQGRVLRDGELCAQAAFSAMIAPRPDAGGEVRA